MLEDDEVRVTYTNDEGEEVSYSVHLDGDDRFDKIGRLLMFMDSLN